MGPAPPEAIFETEKINAGAASLARLKRIGVDCIFAHSGTDLPPLIEGVTEAQHIFCAGRESQPRVGSASRNPRAFESALREALDHTGANHGLALIDVAIGQT